MPVLNQHITKHLVHASALHDATGLAVLATRGTYMAHIILALPLRKGDTHKPKIVHCFKRETKRSKLPQNRAESGPSLAALAPIRVESAEVWPKIGMRPISFKAGAASVGACPILAKCGPELAQIAPISPDAGSIPPKPRGGFDRVRP